MAKRYLHITCLVIFLCSLAQSSLAGDPSRAGEPDVDPGRRLETIVKGKTVEDIGYLPLYMMLSGGRETAEAAGLIILLAATLAILTIWMPVPSTRN